MTAQEKPFISPEPGFFASFAQNGIRIGGGPAGGVPELSELTMGWESWVEVLKNSGKAKKPFETGREVCIATYVLACSNVGCPGDELERKCNTYLRPLSRAKVLRASFIPGLRHL